LFASAPLTLAGGTIADIWGPDERGALCAHRTDLARQRSLIGLGNRVPAGFAIALFAGEYSTPEVIWEILDFD
jgi:hypothetical protein